MHDKKLSKTETRREFYQLDEVYLQTPPANILNGEKCKASPLLMRYKGRVSLSSPLSNNIGDVLAKTLRQEKETRRIQVGREDINLSFTNDVVT